MYGNYNTYREYANARISALKACAWPAPWSGHGLTPLELYKLRTAIDAEGYDHAAPGWDDLLHFLQCGVGDIYPWPEAPAGCECEGCNERREEAAARLIAAVKRQPPAQPRRRFGSLAAWKACRLCNQLSQRAGFMPDGLCPGCYARPT